MDANRKVCKGRANKHYFKGQGLLALNCCHSLDLVSYAWPSCYRKQLKKGGIFLSELGMAPVRFELNRTDQAAVSKWFGLI